MIEPSAREVAAAKETLADLPPMPWYWSRTIWLGVFDKIVNGITVITALVLAFSQQDFVQQNPDLVLWIGVALGLLNIVKSFAADVLRWIGGLPLTPIVSVLFALSLLLLPGMASAEEVAILVNDANPGTYLLTVNADKSVTVNPIRVVRPGNNPAPPPINPPPGNPTPFELEVETQAKAAIALGGSLTTGAGFSEVYAIVSDGVSKGTIDHTRCLEAVNLGTAAILSRSVDGAKWSTFELTTRNALQTLDARGNFKTKEDYAAALKQVANGLNRATGHKNLGTTLLTLDVSTPAKLAAAVKANGILDGIDLVKLMELIKFIVELFKLFAPK